MPEQQSLGFHAKIWNYFGQSMLFGAMEETKPRQDRVKTMFTLNPQAGSKQPIQEAGKDQHKIKTANQASIAKREELSWKEWTTGPRADSFRYQIRFLKCREKTADNLKEQVQWIVAEKANWLKKKR